MFDDGLPIYLNYGLYGAMERHRGRVLAREMPDLFAMGDRRFDIRFNDEALARPVGEWLGRGGDRNAMNTAITAARAQHGLPAVAAKGRGLS